MKSHLKKLTNAVLVFLKHLDKEEAADPVGGEHGSRVANLANELDFVNDEARYFGLGVSFRNDKKEPLP